MEDIKMHEKWFYAMGSLGKDFISGMFSTYLMIFYTDVFGIGAAAAGIILMVARIWDAILNPIIGTTVDRTRTKWGRCRPYLFAIPIPFVLFSILTFTVPNLSGIAKLAYAYVTYILAGTFFTFYDVALWSMFPSLTSNLKSRGTLIGLARTFTIVAMLVVATFAMPMVKRLGGSNIKHGYTVFMIIISVISIGFSWLTFFNTKEKITVSAQPPKFKEHLGVLVNNKPLYAVIAGVIVNSFNMGINSAVAVYYLIYFLKVPQLIPIYMFLTLGASMIAMSTAGIVIKRFGNRKSSIYSLAISIIPTALIFFIPAQKVTIIFVLMILSSFFCGIPFVSTTGMLAETVDYTELKTGIRADGLLFSFNSFSIQFGIALASGLAGVILQSVGYIPNAASQSSTTLLWINLLRTILPAIVCLIALLAVRTYPINKEDYEKISDELKIKHDASATGTM